MNTNWIQHSRILRWCIAPLLFSLSFYLACSPAFDKEGNPANQQGSESVSAETTTPDGSIANPTDGSTSTDARQAADDASGSDSPPASNEVPCPPTEEFFREKLWAPVLSSQCLGCHQEDGSAQHSRLVFVLPSVPNAMQKNLKILSEVARIKHKGESVLLLRPTGLHPEDHTGGALIPVGGATYIHMVKFVAHATGAVTDCKTTPHEQSCTEATPGKRRLRRLTRSEYDNTVRDLFGIPSTWGSRFVADTVVHGFDNEASALTVSPLLADQLRKAAEEITTQAVKKLSSILPCNPQQTGGRDCAKQFLQKFGLRVFREPLRATTLARYLKLFDLGAKSSFEDGISLVLKAMLQSPYFLYRQELGALKSGKKTVDLTPYEIASELSYFFWGTMPDNELLQSAASGKLSDPAEIQKQATRLLNSPRSRYALERFVVQWLGTSRVQIVPKDATLYAGFSNNLRAALLEEAKRFVTHVVENGKGTFEELLTANYSMLSKQLSEFYGVLPPPQVDSAGFGKVVFQNVPRGGVLTLGSVLATHAGPNSSSPIHRGLMVREKFLCQTLPPPPANINAEPPGLDPKKTTRERYSQHSQDKVCSGCHSMIDPIGFSFERYDGIGRYRKSENNKPIDVKGKIINSTDTDGSFEGVRELATLLAKSPEVKSCFALQWMRWAYGNDVEKELPCVMKKVQADFRSGKQTIRELLLSIVGTVHVRQRGVSDLVAPLPEPGPEPVADGGASDAGAGSEPVVPEATPEPPEPPQNLDVTTIVDSKWQTGYCNRVKVTNKGTQGVTWSIKLKVQGTIKQLWNATSQVDGAYTVFSGASWNAVVAPGKSAEFGFCASLP